GQLGVGGALSGFLSGAFVRHLGSLTQRSPRQLGPAYRSEGPASVSGSVPVPRSASGSAPPSPAVSWLESASMLGSSPRLSASQSWRARPATVAGAGAAVPGRS